MRASEIGVYDATAWACALGVLIAVTVLGGLIPSLRASRIDPARVLRSE